MFRILMRAGEVPIDRIVTKRSGEKPYRIRDKIVVYNKKGDNQEIKADAESRFLISDTGDANVIGSNVLVLWYAEIDDLMRLEYDV